MEDKQIKKYLRLGVRAHAHDVSTGGHGKLDAAWYGVGHPGTGDHRQCWAANLRLVGSVVRACFKKDRGWVGGG